MPGEVHLQELLLSILQNAWDMFYEVLFDYDTSGSDRALRVIQRCTENSTRITNAFGHICSDEIWGDRIQNPTAALKSDGARAAARYQMLCIDEVIWSFAKLRLWNFSERFSNNCKYSLHNSCSEVHKFRLQNEILPCLITGLFHSCTKALNIARLLSSQHWIATIHGDQNVLR